MRIDHIQIHIQGDVGDDPKRNVVSKTITWTRTEDGVKGYTVSPGPTWASDLKLMNQIQNLIEAYNGGQK